MVINVQENGPNEARNTNTKLPKKNAQKWQNDPELPKMTQNGQKLPKMAKNGLKCLGKWSK